jgi:hypothetical protein
MLTDCELFNVKVDDKNKYHCSLNSCRKSWDRDGTWSGRPGFKSQKGKIFFFSIASRPALRPTQPPIQWVPWELLPRGLLCSGVKLTTHLHLVPRSRRVELYLHSPYVFMRGDYLIKHRDITFTFFTFKMLKMNIIRDTARTYYITDNIFAHYRTCKRS